MNIDPQELQKAVVVRFNLEQFTADILAIVRERYELYRNQQTGHVVQQGRLRGPRGAVSSPGEESPGKVNRPVAGPGADPL